MFTSFIGNLRKEFHQYNRAKLIKDFLAGITVAAVALPLALAFGVSSGADASAGLITAIIAGLVIGSLSGAFYQISGPTGAMAAVLVSIIAKYQLTGIFIATFIAGIFLLVAGIFRLGVLTTLIPSSVITGFTSGIAFIIASGQIKNLFGVNQANADLAAVLKQIIHLQFKPIALIIGLLSILLIILYPKKWGQYLPASLVTILIATIFTLVLKLDVATVGNIPQTLIPEKHLTISNLKWPVIQDLLLPAFSIAALGMIESLLCGASAGRMTGVKLNNNQELIAQGIGNMILPFFGGIPATAAIARTSVAIKSGAQTRLTGIFHALILLCSMFIFAPFMSNIPLAALAAVLIMTAFRMNEWSAIRYLYQHRMKSGLIKFAVTMVITIVFDLSVAIMVGILLGFILFIYKVARIEITSSPINTERLDESARAKSANWTVVYISGPLFFLTADTLSSKLEQLPEKQNVILSLRGVPMVDVTSLRMLLEYCQEMQARKQRVIFSSMNQQLFDSLKRAGIVDLLGKEAFYPAVNQFLITLWQSEE
ncbi:MULTISPECIES: SulP family inorganic anion transporter [unclassified Enterococcus]|uniref:SulP family inorganic anion transporter n=1 Tax=unclassified Enterococcus TaxID=2608891 RepID=UPI001555FE51|nr:MULTISPECIES: SulP family inorganic anion transporter [unclassified Enterococcus]MBS7578204.1 SulP family inorganic anion transporter [Enterococcus sp. MMGLQ5-2]MBS7585420.1 SulP family inorganic anion transporter [Enterococcus sp. MMGLQ5-1]NPD13277.1 SulP family inorganic anion transporter [Enterococcus sp. MMGLQ5-1]NPD38035.1 SulP family inorganic anion transporter [Enterococcus sp. MMGLQ5-2]